MERLIDEALSAVEQEADSAGTETEGGGHSSETNLLSMKVCEQVRDAAMMAMMAGHVCLTVRISIIRTIKASCFSSTPCTHHGCTLSGCTDNRLEVVEQTSNSLEMPKYRIVVPHHKTASRGIMMPPVSIYSRKLTKLLNIWEQRARPQVTVALQNDKYALCSVMQSFDMLHSCLPAKHVIISTIMLHVSLLCSWSRGQF